MITLDEIVAIHEDDTPFTSGDDGLGILAVRNDVAGSLASADGDYTPLQVDANGALRISGSFSAGNEYAEDSAHTSGDTGGFVLAVANHTEGALHSTDGDYAALQVDSSGRLRTLAEVANTVTVTATDLDIRDLSATQDNIAISDGTDTLAINTNGSIGVEGTVADDAADAGNPIKVGGRAIDGALTAVADGDRVDLAMDLYRRTFVNNSANIAIKTSVQDAGTTASEIAATPLAGRKSITIQNRSNRTIYIGFDNTVTADDAATGGIEIPKGVSATYEFGEDIDIWMIAAAGATNKVKILEAA